MQREAPLVIMQPLLGKLLYWLMPDLRRLNYEWSAMMVRHAKEQAELDAWEAECWRYLAHGPDTAYLAPPEPEPALTDS